MAGAIPAVLSRLLSADPPARDQAWADFLGSHHKLLLYVARSFGGDYDAAMDRYACLIEQLSQDDYRRLRVFAEDGRSEFTTWLVLVAQRICLDHHRHRYGRDRSYSEAGAVRHAARRGLADLAGALIDISTLPDGHNPGADHRLRTQETSDALQAAVATLSPHDQMLLQLRFEDDLSMGEIARLLGHPTRFHTHRRLRRLLRSLRAQMSAHAPEALSVTSPRSAPC